MTVPTANTETYLTTAEAAKELGVSQESVRKYCKNHETGGSPAIKGQLMGRSWFIHPRELERYIKNRRPVGAPPKL